MAEIISTVTKTPDIHQSKRLCPFIRTLNYIEPFLELLHGFSIYTIDWIPERKLLEEIKDLSVQPLILVCRSHFGTCSLFTFWYLFLDDPLLIDHPFMPVHCSLLGSCNIQLHFASIKDCLKWIYIVYCIIPIGCWRKRSEQAIYKFRLIDWLMCFRPATKTMSPMIPFSLKETNYIDYQLELKVLSSDFSFWIVCCAPISFPIVFGYKTLLIWNV